MQEKIVRYFIQHIVLVPLIFFCQRATKFEKKNSSLKRKAQKKSIIVWTVKAHDRSTWWPWYCNWSQLPSCSLHSNINCYIFHPNHLLFFSSCQFNPNGFIAIITNLPFPQSSSSPFKISISNIFRYMTYIKIHTSLKSN